MKYEKSKKPDTSSSGLIVGYYAVDKLIKIGKLQDIIEIDNLYKLEIIWNYNDIESYYDIEDDNIFLITEINNTITNSKYKHGNAFSCFINSTYCEGKISIDNGIIYLCQEIAKGCKVTDKQGYTKAWCIGKGSEQELDCNGVTKLILKISIPPLLKRGFPFEPDVSYKITPEEMKINPTNILENDFYPYDLNKLDNNRSCSMQTVSGSINNGKIYISKKNHYYILHNHPSFQGTIPEEGLQEDYKYSWCLLDATKESFKRKGYKLTLGDLLPSLIIKNNELKILNIIFKSGDGFKAVYKNTIYMSGKVHIDNNTLYLCQDIEGDDVICNNKHGYKYSLNFSDISKLYNIEKLTKNSKFYPPINRTIYPVDLINNGRENVYFKANFEGISIHGQLKYSSNVTFLCNNQIGVSAILIENYKFAVRVNSLSNSYILSKEGITNFETSNTPYNISTNKNYPNSYDDSIDDPYTKDLRDIEHCEKLYLQSKQISKTGVKAMEKQSLFAKCKSPVIRRNTTDLTSCHGISYSCNYRGSALKGKISVRAGNVYLCNKEGIGSLPPTISFNFSNALDVYKGSREDLEILEIHNLQLNIKLASHVKDPRIDLKPKLRNKRKRLDLSVKKDQKQLF